MQKSILCWLKIFYVYNVRICKVSKAKYIGQILGKQEKTVYNNDRRSHYLFICLCIYSTTQHKARNRSLSNHLAHFVLTGINIILNSI